MRAIQARIKSWEEEEVSVYSASGSNQTGGIARVGRSMEFFLLFFFLFAQHLFFSLFFLFRLSRGCSFVPLALQGPGLFGCMTSLVRNPC